MTHARSENGSAATNGRDVGPSSVALACGHSAPDSTAVVVRPTRKIKYDCPMGCGLQVAVQ